MKRTLPLHLLFALAAMSLFATGAFAATRCSDDPESCVKSASKVARPAVQLASSASHAPTAAPAQVQAVPAAMVAPAAKKPAPLAKKPAPKPRTSSPTPGMGMLLKLSPGGGDISWTPGKTSETPGQSWVL